MNNFKDLDKENLDDHSLPLGIKSNVQNQLGGFRTFGSIIEVYLSRVLEILAGLFGGNMQPESNTHMLTLFTSSKEVAIDGTGLMATLNDAFGLTYTPEILWILPVEEGMEISIKLSAKDAAKIKRKIKSGKVSDLQLELR